MRRLLRTLIVLLALGLVLVVSGDFFHRTTGTTTTTTSEPVTAICLATQIQGTWVDGSAGAGTAYAWITLTNSQATCALPAWLDLVMGTDINSTVDQFAHIPTLSDLTRPDGSSIQQADQGVTLARQETATVALSFTDRSGCDQATTVTLSWLAGGGRQILNVPATYLVTQCSGPSAFVSPVFR